MTQRMLGMVLRRRGIGAARQDQRHARLVDQDRVGLVDDGHAQPAQQCRRRQPGLQPRQRGRQRVAPPPWRYAWRVRRRGESVAQVVEHQFLGRDVGDVAAVGARPHHGVVGLHHPAYGQAERGIQRLQVLRIACHQVVVGGDHVHRHAGQRPGRGGQRHRQGLALAGGHLGEPAFEHGTRGDQLGVEGLCAQRPLCRAAVPRARPVPSPAPAPPGAGPREAGPRARPAGRPRLPAARASPAPRARGPARRHRAGASARQPRRRAGRWRRATPPCSARPAAAARPCAPGSRPRAGRERGSRSDSS